MAAATAIAIGAAVVSAGVAAHGQYQAASAAQDAANYNNQLAQDEARVKENENHENVIRQRADKRKALAQARARLAVSGAAQGAGSSVDILTALDTRLETQIQDSARSAQLEARSIRYRGEVAKFEGQQQARALRVQGFTTLLDGAKSATSQFSQAKSSSSGSSGSSGSSS